MTAIMAASPRIPATRWILLGLLVLISLFIWRKPYQQEPSPSSDPFLELSQDHIPPKVYEADSDKNAQKIMTEPNADAMDDFPEYEAPFPIPLVPGIVG